MCCCSGVPGLGEDFLTYFWHGQKPTLAASWPAAMFAFWEEVKYSNWRLPGFSEPTGNFTQMRTSRACRRSDRKRLMGVMWRPLIIRSHFGSPGVEWNSKMSQVVWAGTTHVGCGAHMIALHMIALHMPTHCVGMCRASHWQCDVLLCIDAPPIICMFLVVPAGVPLI